MIFRRLFAAALAVIFISVARADLVVSAGPTTVRSDSATASGGVGSFDVSAGTYAGATTIESGATLQLGTGASRTFTVDTVTFGSAGTFSLLGSGDVVNNGTLVLNQQAVVFNQDRSGAGPDSPIFLEWWDGATFRLALANIISGTGSLEQTGAGTYTLLTGANTYSGRTTLAGGTLALAGAGRLGAGELVLTGGTLDLGPTTATTVSSLNGTSGTVTGGGALTVDSAGSDDYAGQLNGVSLIKSGSGTLTLSGAADNSSASATVNAGTLVLAKVSAANVHALGSSLTVGSGATAQLGGTGGDQLNDAAAVDLRTGGTLDLNGRSETIGALNGAGTVTTMTAGGATLDVSSAGAFTGTLIDGAGTLALVKSGSGTLTLSGANTYSGGTTLTGGTLALGSAEAIGTTGAIALSGGTLQWSAANTTDYSSRFSTAAGQAYNFDTNGQDIALASALTSADAALAKSGAGTLTLSGANTYSGGTSLAGGTLALGSGDALGSAGTITFNGGALQWSAANTTDYSDRFSTATSQAYRFDTNGQDIAFASALTSTGGSLEKSGAGTLTLSGASTLSGGTTVTGGTLTLTNGAYATGELTIGSGAILRTNANTVTASALSGAGTIYGSLGDLDVTGAASATFSGALVQASLVKSGSGTLTLSGGADNNSAYATVTGGTLVLAKDSSSVVHALGTGSAHRIASGGTLRLGGSGGDQIYDGGTLNLETGGTLDLSTRSETIASGATLAGDVHIDLAGTTRGATYGSLTINGSVTLGGALTLNLLTGYTTGSTYNLFDYTGATGNWSAVSLAGLSTGSFNSSGNLWTLNSGDTHYTFDLTSGDLSSYLEIVLASGTRTLAATTQLGSAGVVTFGGGTLQWAADNTTDYSANFSAAANQAYNLDTNDQHVTLAPALTSSGGTLTKLGSGTLTLSGANTYDGGTTISAGTLALTRADAAGSGAIVNDATLALAATDSFTLASAVSGAGSLVKSGSGTVTLTGANTYTGGTVLAGGTLALGSAGALGNSGAITFTGGTLQWTAANTTDYSGRFLSAAGQAFRFDTNGQDVTFATAFFPGSGGSLTKLGAGTLTFDGTVLASGATTVSGGTLRLTAASGALGDATLAAGATLAVGADCAIDALSGSGTVTGGALHVGYQDGSSTFNGVVQDILLLKEGAGTITLAGAAANSGARLNVAGGTLVLAKDSSATVHAVDSSLVLTGGTVQLAGTGGDQIADTLVADLRSDTLDLNGRDETALGLIGTGGTLTNTAADTTATFTLGGSTESDVYVFAGAIGDGAGQVALTKTGVSSLKLTGANTYTGPTTINSGGLIVDATASLTGSASLALAGDAAVTVVKGSAVSVGALSGTSGTMLVGGHLDYATQPQADFGAITVDTGADSTFSGALYNLALNKAGAGTLTLAPADSAGLLVHVDGGTLVLAGQNRLVLSGVEDGATHTVAAGATLRLAGTGGDQIAWDDNLAVAAGGTFDLNGRSEGFSWLTGTGLVTNTAAGTLGTLTLGAFAADGSSGATFADGAGQLAFVKSQSGTLTLTGASTHTGGTTVAGGTLQIGAGGTAGSLAGDVALANGTALAFNRSDALTFAGAVSGTGSLVKLGAGTLTLTGANTHSGGTLVSAGTLRVDGSLASTVTIESGATLGGSGNVGAVSLLSGATLAPGNSPGWLTIGSGSSLAGNVVMEIAGTARGVSYDAIDVSGAGALTLGGTLTLDFTSAVTTGVSYHLFDFATVTGNWSGVSLAGLYSGNLTEAGGVWSLTTGGYDFAFGGQTGDLIVTTSAVPEPAAAALLVGLGALGLLFARRVRRSA